MSDLMKPEGWTDRMKPMPSDKVATPEIGGKFHNTPIPNGVAPVVAPVAEEPAIEKPAMSDEAQYWYDECLEARKQYQEVAPLAPFVDVIGYLNSTPDAVTLIMNHMREADPATSQNPEVNAALNEPIGEPNRGIPRGNQSPAPMAPQTADFEQAVRAQHEEMLKSKGVPEHETDRYVKFLMSPGELKPNEMFDMYEGLRASRGAPISMNKAAPTDQQPGETPQEGSNVEPRPEMPPLGIAGMSGGAPVDPKLEAHLQARANVRHVLDPNNV